MKILKTTLLTTTLFSACLGFAQATNQPRIENVDVGIFVFDNMLYHQLDFASGQLPIAELMLYKKAEHIFILDKYCTFDKLSKERQFQNLVKSTKAVHLGGPMLGNITTDGVDVWVRTVKPELVRVDVYDERQTKKSFSNESKYEDDLSVVVPITGLKPNASYTYKVFVGDVEISTKTTYNFTTPSDKLKDDTRIVFGGDFHRYGLANVQQAQTMVDRKPLAFLALGDIAVQDKRDNISFHCLDYLARDLYPAWQNLVSKVPVYATWDDHDYLCDDGYNQSIKISDKDKKAVWKVFKDSWVNPSYGFNDDRKGVFFKTRIGCADVIMLDNRYLREENSLLGNDQFEWLKQELLKCDGEFIIISCGTMFSDYVSKGKDSWGAFGSNQREELFTLIEENNIKGVLLISGDRHGARGFTIPRKSGFNFYEFGVGSLGGLGGQPDNHKNWKDVQLYGTSKVFAFGEFTFDTKLDDPTVTFKLIREDGKTIYQLVLTQSQLTPKQQ